MNSVNLYSTSLSDNDKSLKISKTSASNSAYITFIATWKNNPTIRSYDLMGAYLSGVSLKGDVSTKSICSTGTSNHTDIKKFNNGFGVSVKLPSGCSAIILSQSFKTTLGGTVYASYQHAITNVTLSDSKKYTIGNTGYGNVFIFTNGMNNKYDGMSGVQISV